MEETPQPLTRNSYTQNSNSHVIKIYNESPELPKNLIFRNPLEITPHRLQKLRKPRRPNMMRNQSTNNKTNDLKTDKLLQHLVMLGSQQNDYE